MAGNMAGGIQAISLACTMKSDKDWDNWVKGVQQSNEAREKETEAERRAASAAWQKQMEALYGDNIARYNATLVQETRRDWSHRLFYEAFLKQYYLPKKEDEFPEEIWDKTCQRLSCFLTKVDAAYDWSLGSPVNLAERLLRPGSNRTTQKEVQYYAGLAQKKKDGKKLSYADTLLTGLKAVVKELDPYFELSKKITYPPDDDRDYALGAVIHLVDDNKPKDLAAWKQLLISGLDTKKHPKPPNMHWKLEEALNQKIDTMEEANLLKKMISDPEFLPDYESLCSRRELMNAMIDSDSIRALLVYVAGLGELEEFAYTG